MPEFNLVDQPWIPCLQRDGGKPQELSLRDTLIGAHEIRELFDNSPLVTVSLHRLLLAILHRNFGPASFGEWKELWQCFAVCDRGAIAGLVQRWHGQPPSRVVLGASGGHGHGAPPRRLATVAQMSRRQSRWWLSERPCRWPWGPMASWCRFAEGGKPQGKIRWREIKVGVLARLGQHRTRTGTS